MNNGSSPAPFRTAQRRNSMMRQEVPFDPRGYPDEYIINYIREHAHKFGIPLQEYIDRLAGAIQVRGIPVTMNSFSGMFVKANTLQLAVDQNFNRLRLIAMNPSSNANSFFLFYKNVPLAPIEIAPGQTYTEDSENPIIDQVWVSSPTVNATFTLYEGVPSI